MSTAMAELLEWVPVGQRLPDDTLTVLLWVIRADCTDWTTGFRDGDEWREAESGGVVDGEVTHWAAPDGPPMGVMA